ncbi:MAG: Cytosine-specific methyltransferase [Candidatus Magasanikbacteria bacterium GW2011_GWA2_42_32]|uniref:Cytosine-specific methyltransferase n=1 Tax=Candidatus Magasanikbacteria bacterium GW2011_GWA2_42_32 TaxID=1619039 RepID=A0A0G1A3U3_9BACT|nr:MAG: Cytosine-specific methyltransferase [Candidatus Magasanikbacteria bacterium GW2011_GWA2_42_32]
MKAIPQKYRAIDLFAGIGGMRLGFERAGFEIVYSNDVDHYACQTYRANFGEIDERDIRTVDIESVPQFDVLLAGFPCQPFSLIGKRDGLEDPRGQLFNEVVRFLNSRKPEAFMLENVKNLLKHNKGETYGFIKKALEQAGTGYTVFEQILDSRNFGVPQHRERAYIVGFKNPDVTFDFPDKSSISGIGRLKDVLEKNVGEKYYLSKKYYTGLMAHKKRHAEKGSGFGCEVLDPDGISNTIVCGNMGRERNLIQDELRTVNEWGVRKLTERECARLQGFPDGFKIPVSTTQAYKQFGNSVSVPVIREVAKALKKSLRDQDSRDVRNPVERNPHLSVAVLAH